MGYIGVKPAGISSASQVDVTGDLTVDTNTLHVDATNNNVGIGDATPDRRLHAKDSSNRVVLVESTDPNAFTVYKGSGTTDDGKVRVGATGDNALIYAGGSERMRIDSSGNVGIGETSPLGTVHIRTSDASLTSVNGNADDLILENNGNCGMSICSSTSGEGNINFIDSGDTNIGRIQYTHSDNKMQFRTNDGIRMTLDGSGNLLVGTTTSDTSTASGAVVTGSSPGLFINNSTTGGGVSLILIRTSHSTADQTKFEVSSEGNVKSRTNSYGSFSDERLKEQIADASSQWDDIKAIEVKNFKFISDLDDADNPKMLGVVAQQVEEVCPALVEDDADGMKTVKYSILYMKSVKALQEAMIRIETLETEMTALKARVTALETP